MTATTELLSVGEKALDTVANRGACNIGSVVEEGRYNDDKARICDDTLLALFTGDFAAMFVLES